MSEFYRQIMSRAGEALPQPRLDGTKLALSYLSNPQECAPVIHITGTNGKTTVSRMIACILTSLGLRVGLFTSPHITALEERIQIDMNPVQGHILEKHWFDIQFQLRLADAHLEKKNCPPLTFFECMTVLAFSCFADTPVDVMVLEVGMGGAWDATNVVDARVCVFTPIDFDHTGRLGNRLEEIAHTKAGIIKPGSFVVAAEQHQVVQECLEDYFASINIGCQNYDTELPDKIRFFGQDFDCDYKPVAGGQILDLRGLYGECNEVFLPLFGGYQAKNASLSLAAVESFFGRVEHDIVLEAFSNITSPGRLQIISKNPVVLLDAAHNPHAAKHLAIALDEFFSFGKIVFILAFLSDKDIEGIIRNLMSFLHGSLRVTSDSVGYSESESTRFSNPRVTFVITQSTHPRAVAADVAFSIAKRVVANGGLIVCESANDAFQYSTRLNPDAIVVSGSISILSSFIPR